jgi:hypothetical protein
LRTRATSCTYFLLVPTRPVPRGERCPTERLHIETDTLQSLDAFGRQSRILTYGHSPVLAALRKRPFRKLSILWVLTTESTSSLALTIFTEFFKVLFPVSCSDTLMGFVIIHYVGIFTANFFFGSLDPFQGLRIFPAASFFKLRSLFMILRRFLCGETPSSASSASSRSNTNFAQRSLQLCI